MLTLPEPAALDKLARLRDLLDATLKTPALLPMFDASEADLQSRREQFGAFDYIVGDFKITKIRQAGL